MVGENLYKRRFTRKPNWRKYALMLVLCASFPSGARAQLLLPEVPIAPEPVGSGARALGRSAFIAVADDATAASWNPAGLINLEKPEASFVGAWRTITNVYSPTDPSLSTDRDNWTESQINFMSYAYPMEVGNTDVVVSVNYHQVYDFERQLNSTRQSVVPGWEHELRYSSEGAISAYSLAGALSMPEYPDITIGANFNWYAQSLLNDYAWQVKATSSFWQVPGLPSPTQVYKRTDTFGDFRGHNFSFGLLWDAYERHENQLTFGLVYHTAFTAELHRELVTVSEGPSVPGSSPLVQTYPQERVGVDYPASLGAGVNYRFSDRFSMAFDVESKKWSKFEKKDLDTGERSSPIEGDTLAYRLGGEYLFLEGARESVFACRAGAFYEPRPTTFAPDPLPVYGLSAGFGWTFMEQFSLDFAYQYRWGEQDLGNIDYSIEENFFVVSLIRYF